MVMFLYRPDYYDITTNENGEDTKGDVYVKIAKHRNGSLENIKLKAKLYIQKFEEQEEIGGFGSPLPQGGSWRPVADNEGAKLFIQKGSRMNDQPGDDMEDTPF
jgi:replicative DNA helicase